MTTLHRKPRGASEQSAAAAALNTRYYTTIDILPSSASSASALASGSGPSSNNASHTGSSKTRRHGGNKYVRRSGLFGSRGSGNGGGSPSSSASSASKKMSTNQLRAFFAACVLVYLSTLYFAEDIVRFGKAVNSDATRQKIFSQWRPMHSAAKQYLRSMVDPANGGTVDGEDGVANATIASEPPLVVEKESEMKKESGGSPAPSMNSEREPPGTTATAAPGVSATSLTAPPQDAPLSTAERTSVIEGSSSVPPAVKNEATANEHAEEENEPKQHEDKLAVDEDDGFDADREQERREHKSTEPEKEEALRQVPDLPQTEMPDAPKQNDDKKPTADTKPRDDGIASEQKKMDPSHLPNDGHGGDDAAEVEKEVQKAAAAKITDNDEFDTAQMEDRMEDSVVAVESQESTQPGDAHTKKVPIDHPQEPPAAVVPSFPGGDLAPVSTPVVVASTVVPTAAAAAIPTTLSPQQTPVTTSETELESENQINGATPPPSEDEVDAHEDDGRVVVEDKEEERVSPTPPKEEEDTKEAETTEPRRHPGRDET